MAQTDTPHLQPKRVGTATPKPFTFANKVPGAGRPFATGTKLGQAMNVKGMRAYQLAGKAEVSNRTLTEYLAGRKRITDAHAFKLAAALGVDVQDIL